MCSQFSLVRISKLNFKVGGSNPGVVAYLNLEMPCKTSSPERLGPLFQIEILIAGRKEQLRILRDPERLRGHAGMTGDVR